METKNNKYDTNPLDPDVQRKTEDVWGLGGDGPQHRILEGATREVGRDESSRANVYSEAPTRRYDNAQGDTGYPSVFMPPTYAPPAQYQPAQAYQPAVSTKPTSRSVLGIGLPEKWAVMLPYAPFYVGLVYLWWSYFSFLGKKRKSVFMLRKPWPYTLPF